MARVAAFSSRRSNPAPFKFTFQAASSTSKMVQGHSESVQAVDLDAVLTLRVGASDRCRGRAVVNGDLAELPRDDQMHAQAGIPRYQDGLPG
jgi:hypothetical protein